MKSRQIASLASATEARYKARTKERENKWAGYRKGDLSSVETPQRIALRAARLGVSPERAMELMEPAVLSLDPAELGFERVLGRKDFLRLDYMERGLRAARAVGRIVIRSGSSIVGFGTGFLIAPRVLLTNNHVLGSAQEAGGSLIEFNFQRKLDGTAERIISFTLRPQELFLTDTALDFSIVAVADTSGADRLSQFGFLPLLSAEGKVNISEAVSIIQHPNGEEKQLALRENEVIDLLESFIHYRTDTSPGSSGSPVFNDQWEVVALHHSGVPERDSQGRILATNGQVWRPEMGETQVKWRANEGARVSRIVTHVRNANLTPEQRRLLAFDTRETLPPVTDATPVDHSGVSTFVDGDQLTMRIPLTVSVRMGLGADVPRATVAAPAPPVVQPPVATGIDGAVEQARQLLIGATEVIEVRKGWKFRNGWITDERSVVVVVRDKLTEAKLRESGRAPVPSNIGGFPVDVRPASPVARLGAEGLALSERFSLEALRIPRIRYKGPAGASALLAPFRERLTLTAHASPDAGFPQLSSFIGRTRRDFRVAMFDFGAPHIVKALTTRLKPSPRRMQITIQPGESLGGDTKADDVTDAEALQKLRTAMGGRFHSGLIRPSTAGGYVASSYHIKVAVRDSEEAWLSSGNWQSSNQPNKPTSTAAQKRALLNNFNREWHVIAKGPKIAKALRAFLDHDFEKGPAPDDVEALAFPLVELPAVLLPAEEAARVATLFEPLTVDEEMDVQLALTPDNYAEVAQDLIESARDKIFFENQSFKLLEENDEKFEALAGALLAKQRAGLDVRIIFRDIGDVTESLERLKDFGFDMSKVRLHPHCHTKGIVVDKKSVLVGSHNWTNHGTVFNRDASLRINNRQVAEYFEKLFLFDWENMSRQRTMFEEVQPRLIRPEQARTAKGRVVSLAEYLGEE
jgi:V8-like Glu-specific endopeptidase